MFSVADNEYGLANERMKWIADHQLVRQTSGIMNSLRGRPRERGSNRQEHPLDPPG